MVATSVRVCDLYPVQCSRVRELEQKFIEGRNLVQKILSERKFISKCRTIEQLEDELNLYNGLTIEASKLDDEYRIITKKNRSDPNYDQLIVMYRGVKNLLRNRIRERGGYSEV